MCFLIFIIRILTDFFRSIVTLIKLDLLMYNILFLHTIFISELYL